MSSGRPARGALPRLLFATLWLAVGTAPAWSGEVSVRLRPQRMAVGERAELTFEITGSELRAPALEPRFALENFQVVAGPARRESLSWINGTLSRSVALSWLLAPERPGRARVHQVRLVVGDRELPLDDQEAWVDEASEPPQPRAAPPDDPLAQLFRDLMPRSRWRSETLREPQILLRAEISPPRPWAGEQLLYTLYLLAERRRPGEGRVSVETIFPRRVPAFRGFWSQDVPMPDVGRAEIVELDGKLWWRQAILQRALFPYEPGTHTIEAAEADLRLVYFRPTSFGLGEEPVRPSAVRRTSNPVEVEVRPLPSMPAAFSGAVGQFAARSELTPARVAAEEAAVLTVELSGDGNLSGLPDPRLPALPGVQVSPLQENTAEQLQGSRLQSTRRWSWSLVPERAGQWRVPRVEWLTFDPTTGELTTVATQPQRLEATPAAPSGRLDPPQAGNPSPATGPAERPLPPWLGAAGLAAALGLAAFALARRRIRPAGRELEARLSSALTEPQPRQAAGEAEAAWREFLGVRYALPPEAPPGQWPRLLADRGFAPEETGELGRVVEDLHYLRYAPQLASTDSLQRELLTRSRKLARRLSRRPSAADPGG